MVIPVFVDSDVILSSLMSSLGAAHLLLHDTDGLSLAVSTVSVGECERVAGRLGLDTVNLNQVIRRRCRIIPLKEAIEKLKSTYEEYVYDANDAHIVAGAVKGKVRYLLTYNIKHFNINRLKDDYGIIVMRPAQFLQYMRSAS